MSRPLEPLQPLRTQLSETDDGGYWATSAGTLVQRGNRDEDRGVIDCGADNAADGSLDMAMMMQSNDVQMPGPFFISSPFIIRMVILRWDMRYGR